MAESRMVQIESLYQSHAPALLRYLQRNFGGCAAADDLLHETFLRLMSRADAGEAAESPRAFLFGIARNVGLTAMRRAKQTRTQPIVDVAASAPAEMDVDLRQMRAAIGKLSEQIRETLELRLREELTYEEIATVLEIPVGTVRSRLHTALRMLRKAMS